MALVAALAQGHQNLKFRAARWLPVCRHAAEQGLTKCGGQRIVVEPATVLFGEHQLGLTKSRRHVRRHSKLARPRLKTRILQIVAASVAEVATRESSRTAEKHSSPASSAASSSGSDSSERATRKRSSAACGA